MEIYPETMYNMITFVDVFEPLNSFDRYIIVFIDTLFVIIGRLQPKKMISDNTIFLILAFHFLVL